MKLSVIALLTLFIFNTGTEINKEVNVMYEKLSETVEKGNYDAYAALYHDDAVLVNGISGTSVPISVALDGWKQGFDDTRAGKMTAGVEFRFSQRFHGETAAHDTGIFHYFSQQEGQEAEEIYIHFEGLFVKKDGEWKFMMEYQKSMATPEEWENLGDG